MTDKQPEALRLAEFIENDIPPFSEWVLVAVASKLRTQHKQIAAYKLLTESQEAQLSRHREQADKFREAIATLQSEREANAILTAAIERKDALLKQALRVINHCIPRNEDNADELAEAIKQELSQ